ncbi:MAG: hypothetical protein FJ271_05665 [Planctomycetes bacterium]|nr:hypothetical protein [Planctomycetota bacterium]
MAVVVFVVVPLGWFVTGWLIGRSVAASLFFCERGLRLGKSSGRWCMLTLPVAYLVLLFSGGSGNAGHGLALFGSPTFFELASVVPFYAVPILAVYSALLYVVRDLTLGHSKGSA